MNKENTNHATQFEGHCAFAVSAGKLNVQGGNHSLIIGDKKYHFSNPIAKMLFKLLPNRIDKANNNWKNR